MDGKRSCKGLWAEALRERRDLQTSGSVLSGCVKGDRQKRQRETYIRGRRVRRQAVRDRPTGRGEWGLEGFRERERWTDTKKEGRETGRGRC